MQHRGVEESDKIVFLTDPLAALGVSYEILLIAFGFPYRINHLPAVVKNIRREICLCGLYFLKCEFVGVGVDFYFVAVGEFAG